MAKPQKPKKVRTGLSESVKTLLAVASVTGTVVGWGMLSRADARAAAQQVSGGSESFDQAVTPLATATPTATATPAPTPTPTVDLQARIQSGLARIAEELPPLPTLVPPPDVPVVQVRPPAQITVPKVEIPAPAAPAPAPASSGSAQGGSQAPQLRSVSRPQPPPPPPPKTRSSK